MSRTIGSRVVGHQSPPGTGSPSPSGSSRVTFPVADLRVEVGGRTYRVDELPDQWDVLWFIQDRLVVVVPLDGPPAEGREVDVEVTVDLRLPYMQIAPQVYVTNHASNRRSLVAHEGAGR